MIGRGVAAATVVTAACWFAAGAAGSEPPTVGLPQSMDLWLSGPELFAVAVDDRRSPVVVRIDRTTPERDGYRYSLVYTGLEPGRYDLRDSLRRADGSRPQGVAPIPVEVRSLRPTGDIRLSAVADGPPALSGGYRLALGVGGALWLIGLVSLIVVRRRRAVRAGAPPPPAETLAERLRSLLAAAIAGTATPAEHAELERTLLVCWVRRLGLRDQDPASLYATLRAHPEVGPLVRQLEAWLHTPHQHTATADLPKLLDPFRTFIEPEKAQLS